MARDLSDFDHELHQDIEELVTTLQLDPESAAYGIAQQVIHEGYDTLSEPQRTLFDEEVIPALDRLRDERERSRIDLSNPD